ncbi:unnamed protein product [Trichogramma brassicae]|uniref:BTB domain-containing protein n=1 Tax=Trichogramma brassicae TaxID=86971 RepID=A0A6H5IVE6_9HYME|nr:unnamed protein product [Trichogramma brassicae]
MFFPTGISGDDDFAKLYLVQCKYDEVEVSFTVTFLVDDKPVKTEKSISRKFNQRVKELGIQKVYRVQNVNELLSAEDVMTIRCELTVRVSEVKETVPIEPIEGSASFLPWHLDFSNLFLSEHLSDVELVAQSGPSVPGHMILLAANSPVLLRMIESAEKRENGRNVVYVNDIRREVLVDMMCFIYKRKVAWSGVDFIGDLLSAAHNYQVEELKQLCETMLSNHLTVKNAMEVYVKAKACNAEHLKAEALRFLQKDEFAGVALSQATEVEHVCQFTISVMIDRRPVVIIRAGSCDFARSSNSYRLRELFKLKNSREVLSEDTLTLRCDLTIVADSESLLIEQPIADAAATRPKWKFNELFLSEHLSDVRLRTACGKTIPAHKALLAAASPIFNKMFSNDMLESRVNFVCINDIGYEALVQMLRYVYATGIRDRIETSVMCELLEAADKYDIEGLRLECERILCANLTVENAIDLLSTALKHNADSLKSRAQFMDFSE